MIPPQPWTSGGGAGGCQTRLRLAGQPPDRKSLKPISPAGRAKSPACYFQRPGDEKNVNENNRLVRRPDACGGPREEVRATLALLGRGNDDARFSPSATGAGPIGLLLRKTPFAGWPTVFKWTMGTERGAADVFRLRLPDAQRGSSPCKRRREDRPVWRRNSGPPVRRPGGTLIVRVRDCAARIAGRCRG